MDKDKKLLISLVIWSILWFIALVFGDNILPTIIALIGYSAGMINGIIIKD